MQNVIAIDGPAASGKSTVASKLAIFLSIPYVNTGSMFRAIAYTFIQNKINTNNLDDIKNILKSLKLEYKKDENDNFSLYVNSIKLDEELRTKEVTNLVSHVATLKEVRDFLKNFQRKIAGEQLIVMEGRDIGSVVFPNAKWKFFVTASSLVRAKRRLLQEHREFSQEELEEVAQSIASRDKLDSTREIAPLKKCDDATEIDTSSLTIDEVVKSIADKIAL